MKRRPARKAGQRPARARAERDLRLVADVGGTHVRLAVFGRSGRLERLRVLPSADFSDLAGAAERYLEEARIDPRRLRDAAVDVASPVAGDAIHLTNLDWRFSIAATRRRLGLRRLEVINDLAALALALPALRGPDLERIRLGKAVPEAPRAVVAPGTGLGVGAVVRTEDRWVAIASEGGHRDLAPSTEREWRVCEWLARRYGHASAERALSGPGIAALDEALAAIDGVGAAPRSPVEVSKAALGGGDSRAREAASIFSALLGAVAGDLALTCCARGGLFLAGGALEGLGTAFDRSLFAERFLAKGRFRSYLAAIPIARVTRPTPALLGLARLLAELD